MLALGAAGSIPLSVRARGRPRPETPAVSVKACCAADNASNLSNVHLFIFSFMIVSCTGKLYELKASTFCVFLKKTPSAQAGDRLVPSAAEVWGSWGTVLTVPALCLFCLPCVTDVKGLILVFLSVLRLV